VALHAQASPADQGGGGILDAVAATAGDGEGSLGPDQPARFDLRVAADVDVEAIVARLEPQALAPGRFQAVFALLRRWSGGGAGGLDGAALWWAGDAGSAAGGPGGADVAGRFGRREGGLSGSLPGPVGTTPWATSRGHQISAATTAERTRPRIADLHSRE